MKKIIKIGLATLILVIMLSAAFGSGIMLGYSNRFGAPIVMAQDQPDQFGVFWEVWQLAENNFVDRSALDPQKLTYGAINGFITALGDEGHTRFLTPDEVAKQEEDIRGTFFGIGAQLGIKDGLPVIVAPFDGSPAAEAGIKAGDIIVEVDGEDVTGLSLSETVDRIRGEKGTEVKLTVYRPDSNESVEIAIIRDEIKVPAVTWGMLPGTDTALVRLSQFNGNIDSNLVDAVTKAKNEGAKSLIIDVRNNPGGLLEQAILVTSEFLKDGNVLLQQDAEGNQESYPVRPDGIAQDIPIVVLVNRGTASSSEIFAGAIQDHQRGQVVGEKTFGTGTVLRPFQLSDGSSLLLGTSEWLTPNGRLIRKHGIDPDVVVEIPMGAELISPYTLDKLTADDMLKSDDKQVLKALELLDQLPKSDTAPKAEVTQ
jgi:carboxyl-terminal processing protease